jgi:hypothetical protein
MLTAQKSLQQKKSEKIVFLEKGFLYTFCFRTFPLQYAFLTYSAKSLKKSENAGHMRPGLWKSCHPREEQ